jgi:predicted aldo/keto reductase-like oxidoreductase
MFTVLLKTSGRVHIRKISRPAGVLSWSNLSDRAGVLASMVAGARPGRSALAVGGYNGAKEGMHMDRRDFLTSAAALGAGLPLNASTGTLPKRPYKNGIELSIIALGGIVVCGLDQKESDRRVAAAFERGVNYFDCAPSYFDGEAEIKLGQSLQPYRNRVFLAEKTTMRDAAGAQAELDRSLQRFHTDHVDLYQFHAVTTNEDVDRILAPGGAAETFFKAKKEGKARHLGFSAHGAPAALRLMDALELDSVLFPVNANTWEFGGFGPQILARAKAKGMARMALKALAFGVWPQSLPHAERKFQKCWYEPIADREMARLALRFSLNQEITAAVPPGDEHIWDLALELACGPLPKLDPEELARLKTQISAREPIFRA